MKRKNRLTLTFLYPGGNFKSKKNFKICKEIIPLQQPALHNVNDTSDVPESSIEFESQHLEESSDCTHEAKIKTSRQLVRNQKYRSYYGKPLWTKFKLLYVV